MVPGYVIYGSVAWNTPWLTEQNLAAALAERTPVLYVDPPVTPLTPIRYGLRRESWDIARDLLHRTDRLGERLHRLQPVALPPRSHPRMRGITAALVRRQVSRAAARLGLVRPVAIWAHANLPVHGAVGEALTVCLVKDWLEAEPGLVGQSSSDIGNGRRALWQRSDLICVTSTELGRTLDRLGHDNTVLRHAFHADLAPRYDAPAPAELARLPRPLLGYAGRIDGRLDFELLRHLAAAYPHGSLVLLGPVSPRLERSGLDRLAAMPNVHLAGTRSREELPRYLAHLDCSLLPYREGEWGRHGSPLKLWDYLYAGPPIVGSGYLSLREFPPPLVNFVSGPEAFAAAVTAALTPDEGGREERRRFALANTWADRARALDGLAWSRLEGGQAEVRAPAVRW